VFSLLATHAQMCSLLSASSGTRDLILKCATGLTAFALSGGALVLFSDARVKVNIRRVATSPYVPPLVAVCCSVQQCAVSRCASQSEYTTRCCFPVCDPPCCSVLQCAAMCFGVLRCVALRAYTTRRPSPCAPLHGYLHSYIHACIHAHTHARTYTHTCTHLHSPSLTFALSLTHTHTHTHTHPTDT